MGNSNAGPHQLAEINRRWYRHVLWLGTHESPDELRKAILANGSVIGGGASAILEKTPISQGMVEVKIIEVLVAELGFKNGGRLGEVFSAAKNQGLELCSAEVGPQQCLQSENRRADEELYIAMKPINSNGLLYGFRVCQFQCH